jgi:small GTP-binding protein
MHAIKVVLLGSASVGKSSLLMRLVKDAFYETMLETVGASFAVYQSPEARFEIWDTAGQERYAPISRLYYGNANIIILVFDISDTTSWKRINELLYEVRQYNRTGHFIIVGNKMDLRNKAPFYKWIHPSLTEFESNIIYVSAKTAMNMDRLKERLHHYSRSIVPKPDDGVVDVETTQQSSPRCVC